MAFFQAYISYCSQPGKHPGLAGRAGGKPRKLTLGQYPSIDLKKARELARAALSKVAGGADPGEEKKAIRAAAAIPANDLVEMVAARRGPRRKLNGYSIRKSSGRGAVGDCRKLPAPTSMLFSTTSLSVGVPSLRTAHLHGFGAFAHGRSSAA